MEGRQTNKVSPIFVVLIGIMAAAIVLTIYHCIVVTWYSPSGSIRRLTRRIRHQNIDSTTESAEFSTVGLIPPARIYSRKEGVVSEDQSMCSICLSDFKEGEEVRLLPECLHCFHVACIDVWLMSHTSCPMCRTDTGSVSVSMETLPREGMVSLGGARVAFDRNF